MKIVAEVAGASQTTKSHGQTYNFCNYVDQRLLWLIFLKFEPQVYTQNPAFAVAAGNYVRKSIMIHEIQRNWTRIEA